MEEIDKDQVEKILQTYREVVENTRRALVFAGVPDRLLFFYIFTPPQLNGMLPEDVVDFYRDIQKAVIIYLSSIGFSQREISRRLRGGSYALVVEALKTVKSSKEEYEQPSDGEDDESEPGNGSSEV